tara:strand:+ start:325 stop:702 length:378 start_codon:yes stop_codon:yes gene_type:complete
MSSFTSHLVVSPLPDGRRWRLARPFTYHLGSKYSIDYINVPKGFVTDFASSPFFTWSIIPSWGRYGKAAVLHDFCYQTGWRTRKDADNLFREAMDVLGVRKWRVFLMFWAVRLFARRAYGKVKYR